LPVKIKAAAHSPSSVEFFAVHNASITHQGIRLSREKRCTKAQIMFVSQDCIYCPLTVIRIYMQPSRLCN